MTAYIYINNEQTDVELTDKIEKLIDTVVNAALNYEKVQKDMEVSVTLTDNENIRILNRDHRDKDMPTDVLSFPMLEFENGEMIDDVGDYFDDVLILGDIIISVERAISQAEEYGHSFERELGFLLCHSVLHLLGYDHEDEDERTVMRQKEEAILDSIDLRR